MPFQTTEKFEGYDPIAVSEAIQKDKAKYEKQDADKNLLLKLVIKYGKKPSKKTLSKIKDLILEI